MTYCNAQKLFLNASPVGEEAADRVRLLLSALGNPERKCSILPVTGEKGKSSVVRMLAGMLAHSGVPSVSVIFPCLDTPKDNVFVGDLPLSIEEFTHYTGILASAVKEVRSSEGNENAPSYSKSELLFSLAVTVAADKSARWLILEIPEGPFSPLSTVRFSSPLTVITSCSERVDPSVTALIHPGLDEVVSARLPFDRSYTAISGACARAGCRLTVPAFSGVLLTESTLRRTVFTYRGAEYTLPLYGEFALSNALCALEAAAALERLGCPLTDGGKISGLARAVLPARCEVLSISPTLLVDAAGDPFSRAALAELIRKKGTALGERVTLCLAEHEDAEPILSSLAPITEAGFRIEGVVHVPKTKENRTATLLLKAAHAGDLILTVGPLPFAHTMRVEFLKALRSL